MNYKIILKLPWISNCCASPLPLHLSKKSTPWFQKKRITVSFANEMWILSLLCVFWARGSKHVWCSQNLFFCQMYNLSSCSNSSLWYQFSLNLGVVWGRSMALGCTIEMLGIWPVSLCAPFLVCQTRFPFSVFSHVCPYSNISTPYMAGPGIGCGNPHQIRAGWTSSSSTQGVETHFQVE